MDSLLPAGGAAVWSPTNPLMQSVLPPSALGTPPSSQTALIDNAIRYSALHSSWQLNQWWALLQHLGRQHTLQQTLRAALRWSGNTPSINTVEITPSNVERQSVIQLVENGNVMPLCAKPDIARTLLLSNSPVSSATKEAHPCHPLLHASPSSSITSSSRSRGRLSGSSGGTTTNRLSYPREFKLMVIDYYKANGQNKYRSCKQFRITKSMLNSWLQKEAKIRASKPGSLKSGRSGRRPQFPNIEKRLFELYSREVQTGRKVNNKWLRDAARSMAACEEDDSKPTSQETCQFSERWLSNFKKRYGIVRYEGGAEFAAREIAGDNAQ